MSPPKSLATYSDIAAIFETIERNDVFPAEIEFYTLKNAHKWRHRAHAYRVRLRKQEERVLGLVPDTGSSRYDNWVLTISGTKVIVSKRAEPVQLLISGQPVQPKTHEQLEAEEDLK